MEVFTLLKFWRNPTGETNITDFDIRNRPPEIDNDDDSLFDLILSAPNSHELSSNNTTRTNNNPNISNVHIQSHDNDTNKPLPHKKDKKISSKRDCKATTKSNDRSHHCDSFSIRKILPIESASKPQSPISLLTSPSKFRFLMLSSTKSPPSTYTATVTPPHHSCLHSISTPKRDRSKRFTTRCDDVVPRDNSLRSKFQRKDGGVVYKYFQMIKPLYARIKIFDTAAGGGGAPAPVRRDDSVLQQQDGIQSAILHCKRSYTSPSSSSVISQDRAMLSRSASDSSSIQRAFNQPRRSAEEEKRSSI